MPNALGHIQPVCALLRVGGAYGEPWTWACVLRYDTPTSVVVEAVERPPTPAEWRAAVAVGRESGIERFRFDRRHERGVVESHEWTVHTMSAIVADDHKE